MSSSSEDELPPGAQRAPRRAHRTPSPFYVPLTVTFYVLLISNGLAAAYAPIQDCDETFNYWDPTHYLQHGYGRQTWEYSPEYGIRSWLYILLHAAVGKVSSIWATRKITQFYAIRFVLGFVCAACETRLYSAISRSLNPRIGVLFLLIVASSPGFFHASAAYLPSSFTMYTSMLGLAAFLNKGGNRRVADGIVWFGFGAIVGWPFAGALLLPMLLEEVVTGALSGRFSSTLWVVARGAYDCLLILILEVLVDSFFFGKTVVVPWNIVAYNVFGGQGRGPNAFGTEPWTFYVRNLLINFHVWFILAVLAAPLIILQALFRRTAHGQSFLRSITFVSPLYMWLAIFTLQPHKEERFMFPVYPFLALNAALSLHWILSYIGTNQPGTWMGLIPAKLKLAAVAAFLLLSVAAGFLRTLGVVTAYRAPLEVYSALEDVPAFPNLNNNTVCLGKEWYRFPSSFFVPNSMRFKFVRSEYRGLLAGEFPESGSVREILAGTSIIPTGMNDRNEEDPGKYVNITECAFLVDSSFPSQSPSEIEPDHIHDVESWDKVSCKKFLDAGLTPTIARLVWLPDVSFLPDRYKRRWGEYCLLRRRS